MGDHRSDHLIFSQTGRSLRGLNRFIRGTSETENWNEYDGKQDKPGGESSAFAEIPRNPEIYQDDCHEVREWNEKQDDEPKRFSGNLEHHHEIVDGNNTCLPGFPGIGEYFPQ